MATVVLAAAGAAIGGAIGGSVLGVSAAVIGRAIGATIGRQFDDRILGGGSELVEVGRIDRFRVMGANEGAAIPKVQGRMRLGGQVIWATRFKESVSESGGGKGGGPVQRNYSYTVSLAVALCEGEITRVGRIWADGEEISPADLTMRVYPGDQTQEPDALIEAVEGAGTVPAYRGTAYVVIEDLELARFGNRVPQFSFEVVRPAEEGAKNATTDIAQGISGVALMPGTGEYALATTKVHFSDGLGGNKSANVNSIYGGTDFSASLDSLKSEMPGCKAVSLIASWFGDDLRIGECKLKPKVEQNDVDGEGMPWVVSSLSRANAEEVPLKDGLSVYGGTPCDRSIIEAISHMNSEGYEVMFYPFILMEQLGDNGLPDPWSDASDQPVLPWRGRITSAIAAGRDGSPDGTQAAADAVEAFFGTVQVSDFQIVNGQVQYAGPDEWSYRRFILHYAFLCAAAGGVESFCIGSEMRGMTQIRGPENSFPAVEALIALAADVRSVLGPEVKLSYAADWSEYFGYHPQDGSGDVFFHLDPLWADANIDFIGMDNYMPLSDWREGDDHADGFWGSIYDVDYLSANIEGGEGYDWFYHSDEARAAQIRTEIFDGAHGEDWVWRYKDIRGWWKLEHFDRVGGVRSEVATAWVPEAKPFRFTEFGCAAIDKGTNQPNKFLDPKSSESGLPHYSNGQRDEFLQRQYYKAMLRHWKDDFNNPVSSVYSDHMIDMDHAYAWAWDARPYPAFPNNHALWSDAENYAAGHWLNGRSSSKALSEVIEEICENAGVLDVDAEGAHGVVRGFLSDSGDAARGELQPLMLAYGVDAYEQGGQIVFKTRNAKDAIELNSEQFASRDDQGDIEINRSAEVEESGRVRVGFVEADGQFDLVWEDATLPDEAADVVTMSDLPLALTRSEGRLVAERWLSEAKVARDCVNFAVPHSKSEVKTGSVVDLGGEGLYRVDRVEIAEAKSIEATRIDTEAYKIARIEDQSPSVTPFVAPVPVFPLFLDLPLMDGGEDVYSPHIAVAAIPWPGQVGVFKSSADQSFEMNVAVSQRASVGVTENALSTAACGVVDRGPDLQVKMASGVLESASWSAVLNGANRLAIGTDSESPWEVIQFSEAELIAPDTYLLRNRLRGQFGTDSVIPSEWPSGSKVVLLDAATQQLSLSPNARTLSQTYRVGPLSRPLDDESYVQEELAFECVGLRPFAPCHLRKSGNDFSWVRRTRIGGDSWGASSVPVGEESDAYLVRVKVNGQIVREEEVSDPDWTYAPADQAADGVVGQYVVEVGQLSAEYGVGGLASLSVGI